MRNSPTFLERRIVSCLTEHRALGFSALRMATDASSDKMLSRTLARMRRHGRNHSPRSRDDTANNIVSPA